MSPLLYCGETKKFVVWISFSATPNFPSAAKTPCIRLALADNAWAAVGAMVETPAVTCAMSGAARVSPWPVMAIVRGSAARAGKARAAARARARKNGVFKSISFAIGCPSDPQHVGQEGQNQGAPLDVGMPKNPVIPLAEKGL